MTDWTALDNPAWDALHGAHLDLGDRLPRAARYHRDVSPIAAVGTANPRSLAELRELTTSGEIVGLLRSAPIEVQAPGWQLVQAGAAEQMVCEALQAGNGGEPVELAERDVPEMLALVKATKPGPFENGTIRMGRYLGIRSEDGRLVAMAGERMKPGLFTEVSAVCTLPEFRGRGYAEQLVAEVARGIVAAGRTPFLHVSAENSSARSVYERPGFRLRRQNHLTVLKAI